MADRLLSEQSPHPQGKRIAFCGTRGLPVSHGGFETAVDEISHRFVQAGYSCDVFCRRANGGAGKPEAATHRGRDLVYVAGSSIFKLDTFISSIQTGYFLWRNKKRYSHVFWFNNANVPGILMTWLARIPMTINTDGLEWRRAKWSWPFKAYYYLSSMIVCLVGKSLVSDSLVLQKFYRQRFFRNTVLIPYGIPAFPEISQGRQREILASLNLEEGRFFLQITRIEPDNLPLEIVKAFVNSELGKQGFKMASVGYKDATKYAAQLMAYDGSSGVKVCKATYDSDVLYTLRRNCFCYVHGNSVGGTNPALLEAMACCPRVLAFDCLFSHEVLGQTGMYFDKEKIDQALCHATSSEVTGAAMLDRAARLYQWDAVAKSYMQLAEGDSASYNPQPLPINEQARPLEFSDEVHDEIDPSSESEMEDRFTDRS